LQTGSGVGCRRRAQYRPDQRGKTTGDVIVDDTEYRANLVAGTRYELSSSARFFELRYIIEGGEHFVLAGRLDLLLGDYRPGRACRARSPRARALADG
jgi:hypothetical protein